MGSQIESSMDEVFLQKLKEVVLENLSNEYFSINDLVREMGLSRSQIHRKLKKIEGKSITQFIREIRLEEALKLLENKVGTAAEIAYRVGFNSPTYFNNCFHEYFGITPGEVGKKPIVTKDENSGGIRNIFKNKKWRIITILSITIFAFVATYYIINKRNDSRERILIEDAIAVLPFINNTGDTSYDHWKLGISELLVSTLSTSEELKIIDNQTIFDVISNIEGAQTVPELSIEKEVATRIAVKSYIAGDYLLSGSIFRINLKLIDTRSNEILKTEFVEGKVDSILPIVGSLSQTIKNYLEIEKIGESSKIESEGFATTKSPEAYKYYIQGIEAFWDFNYPVQYLHKAIEIDSNFSSAYFYLSIHRSIWGAHSQSKENMLKAFEGIDNMPPKMQLWVKAFMSQYMEKNPSKTISYFKQVAEIDPLLRINWFWLGLSYLMLEDYDEALAAFEQIQSINNKLGTWKNIYFYFYFSRVYIFHKEYRKAQKLLKEGSQLFPESYIVNFEQVVCALSQNDSASANHFINQYKKNAILDNQPEPFIIAYIGNMHYMAGKYKEAEDIYRQALDERLKYGAPIDSLHAGNNLFWYYTALGNVLIKKDINIDEGMECILKAIDLSQDVYPDHPLNLTIYGYGLFKQGKYEQALLTLRKAEKGSTMYDNKISKYIKEVEQALSSN